MVLSTALCLPMSSRTTSMVPSASNSAAPCRPPVLAKTFCALRSWSGMAESVVGGDHRRVVAGGVPADGADGVDGTLAAHSA